MTQKKLTLSRCLLIVLAMVLTTGFPAGLIAAEPTDFATATRAPRRPGPSKTITDKSLAELKSKVEQLWDGILFEENGKRIDYVVTLHTEAGDIEIEMWPDVAPNHCRSFLALGRVGYYDGLSFHRVIPGFMIQGGCSQDTGGGGPGYELKAEFNDRLHTRGVLSMARARDPNSAGSQFFVCVDRAANLDEKYTAFGKVTQGMEAADLIVNARRNSNDRPDKPVKIKSVTVAIKAAP